MYSKKLIAKRALYAKIKRNSTATVQQHTSFFVYARRTADCTAYSCIRQQQQLASNTNTNRRCVRCTRRACARTIQTTLKIKKEVDSCVYVCYYVHINT